MTFPFTKELLINDHFQEKMFVYVNRTWIQLRFCDMTLSRKFQLETPPEWQLTQLFYNQLLQLIDILRKYELVMWFRVL